MNGMNLVLDKAGVEALIPHRAPMLLVDAVLAWDALTITTQRTFAEDEVFFQGHFPGNPILPGVVSLEAMAQTAALHTSLSKGLNAQTAGYLLVGVESVRWKAPVKPGQTVRYTAEKVREKLGVFSFKTRAMCGDALVAEAAFTAKLIVNTTAE